jgi:hypothetical protein
MTHLLQTLHHCEATCEHMTTFLLSRPDVHARVRQLQLLRDCADICSLTAKYIARHSAFSKTIAALCASICEVCGNECLRFPDPESQKCGQICINCARECQAFAAA